jgi:hypothetical protein
VGFAAKRGRAAVTVLRQRSDGDFDILEGGVFRETMSEYKRRTSMTTATGIVKEQVKARAFEAAKDNVEFLEVVKGYVIQSDNEYADAAELLKIVKHKFKVLDEERTVSVKPLNDEVKEINAWFKPALDRLKDCEGELKRIMGAYSLAKQQEQQRILAEAAKAAEAALVTASDPQANVMALVQQATEAQAPRVAGVSVSRVWRWELVDAEQVPSDYWSIDPAKLDAAVKAGARDIPGVRIYEDARVIARS